jgi:hypothetical protein
MTDFFSVRVGSGQRLGASVMSSCQLVAHRGKERYGILQTDGRSTKAVGCHCPEASSIDDGEVTVPFPNMGLRLVQHQSLARHPLLPTRIFGGREVGYAEFASEAEADRTLTAHCDDLGHVWVISYDREGAVYKEAAKNFKYSTEFLDRYLVGNPLVEVEVVGEKNARIIGPARILRAVNIASGGEWPSKYGALVFRFHMGVQPHFSSLSLEPAGVFQKLLEMAGACTNLLLTEPGFLAHSTYFTGHFIAEGLKSDIVAHHLPFISKRSRDLIRDLPQGVVVAIASLKVVTSLWRDVQALRHATPLVKCEAALHVLLSLAGCASLILLWGWGAAGPTALTEAVAGCVTTVGQYGTLVLALGNIFSLLLDRQQSTLDKLKSLCTKLAVDAIITLLGIDAKSFVTVVHVLTRNQGLLPPLLARFDALGLPLTDRFMPVILEARQWMDSRKVRPSLISGIESTWRLVAPREEPKSPLLSRHDVYKYLAAQAKQARNRQNPVQHAEHAIFITTEFLLFIAESQRLLVRAHAATPRVVPADPEEPAAPLAPRWVERASAPPRQRAATADLRAQERPSKRRRLHSPPPRTAN